MMIPLYCRPSRVAVRCCASHRPSASIRGSLSCGTSEPSYGVGETLPFGNPQGRHCQQDDARSDRICDLSSNITESNSIRGR
jgi:hypothetical protein